MGAPFKLQRRGDKCRGQIIYFSPVLNISNCITIYYILVQQFLYRYTIYLMHSLPKMIYLKNTSPPLEIEWWPPYLKGLAQAKIIKKSVILFRVLNMTI